MIGWLDRALGRIVAELKVDYHHQEAPSNLPNISRSGGNAGAEDNPTRVQTVDPCKASLRGPKSNLSSSLEWMLNMRIKMVHVTEDTQDK
jgi:hypothetical protein